MIEIAIAVVMAVLLVATAAIAAFVPWTWLISSGVALSGFGLLFGVPASAEYHRRLALALARLGPLPAYWWLHPTPHHEKLDALALAPVMRVFWVGAAGFGVSLLGCSLVIAGLLMG